MLTPVRRAPLPSDYIWALVSGLAGDQRRNRVLVMLQAFVDESYDDNFYVMAGWVATAKQWAAFADEWQQFLDMKSSIKYLKMNDAMTLKGEFRWWREESRNEKIQLLMGCISDHAELAISCYMPHRKYEEIFEGLQAEPKGSPYGFMLTGIIKELVHHQPLLGLNEKIDFIFDDEVIEKEKIRREWNSFKEANPEIEKWLGDEPQFKDDLSWKPLQAADMLAWLVRDTKRREKFGLAPGQLLPTPTGAKPCPMISFGWNEQGLRDLRRKMDHLRPYLIGTWGQLRFASFIDPDNGTNFTIHHSESELDDFIRRRKKQKPS